MKGNKVSRVLLTFWMLLITTCSSIILFGKESGFPLFYGKSRQIIFYTMHTPVRRSVTWKHEIRIYEDGTVYFKGGRTLLAGGIKERTIKISQKEIESIINFLKNNSFDQIRTSNSPIISNSIEVVISVHSKDIDQTVGTEGVICINPNIITDKPEDFGKLEDLGKTEYGDENNNTELNRKILFFANYFENFIKNKFYK